MPRLNIAIICGGVSPEHEVSLQSAQGIVRALDRSKFNPFIIGIHKTGEWYGYDSSEDFLENADNPQRIRLAPSTRRLVCDPPHGICEPGCEAPAQGLAIDVVFPVLHGPFGEDGSLQGLLRMLGMPFVGSGVLGSALGMDKDMAKRIFASEGLPSARYVVLRRGEGLAGYAELVERLGSPLFVKPANMGSSVGVSRVKSEAEFMPALERGLRYDSKLLVEERIVGRELECAVLGNSCGTDSSERLRASAVGEVLATQSFYSYEAKYLDSTASSICIPADIPAETQARIQNLALRAYTALGCAGLARVDFFLAENSAAHTEEAPRILINEVNSLPGFTSISMYPKLWQASGLPYSALITKLIELAQAEHTRSKLLTTSALDLSSKS